jgi:3-oxoacyl-[acyl-carrier protein] reductase
MKHALVTGASSGIGLAIARKFLQEGCFVFINFLSGDTSALAAQLDAEFGGQYQFVPADLSTMDDMNGLVAEIKAALATGGADGKLDYLVLNAGATARGDLQEMTPEDWNHVLAINLTVPVFLVQAVDSLIPDHGRIIFIGSLMGILPHSMSLAYGVTKAGVNFLAQNLPKFFEGRDITVNAIAPGFVETPWQANKPAEIRQNIENKVALHRFAETREIADLAWHITQNEYLNGSVIRIDGGYGYK